MTEKDEDWPLKEREPICPHHWVTEQQRNQRATLFQCIRCKRSYLMPWSYPPDHDPRAKPPSPAPIPVHKLSMRRLLWELIKGTVLKRK